MAEKRVVRLSQNALTALEQDQAAGGAAFRKMRTTMGGIVTVSLSVSDSAFGSRVILRFKWGGATIQRLVGTVTAASRREALKLGWEMIREDEIVEKEGWSWVSPLP